MFEHLDQKILGNTLWQWLAASAVLIITVLLLWIIKRLAMRGQVAPATPAREWNQLLFTVIAKTRFWFLLLVGIELGLQWLKLPQRVSSVSTKVFMLALLLQAGFWCSVLINHFIDSSRRKAQARNPGATTALDVIGVIIRIALWSTVLLLAMDNLGLNVTSLLAGLGIGGVAVALALQNILGDLFASFSIVLDKPFVNGDFLVVDDFLGNVEHIGIKTTRLRSLSGEQLVFANSDLLKSRIRNYGRMYERRVLFRIGVTYQTPRNILEDIPRQIRAAVESLSNTRFDRCHFVEYGAYALLFETVFYVLSPDYNTYMDIQQAINFDIHARFEQQGIEFAYPSQTLFVSRATA